MLNIAVAKEMNKIDRHCIERLQIPSIVLMENAALKIIKNIDMNKFNSFAIVCGTGNNGGDGFAAARHIAAAGKSVHVFFIGFDPSTEKMSMDCRTNYSIIKNMNVPVTVVNKGQDDVLAFMKEKLKSCDITLDAIFGTGISRDVEGIYKEAISVINECSNYIISVDVPSGFESDSGAVLGDCVAADETVTFQLYKRGFLKYGSENYTGKIIVEDIGIPENIVEMYAGCEFLIDRNYAESKLRKRSRYSHKGSFGRVIIAAGSGGFTGAAYISTQGAVKSGAGLVTLGCPHDIQDIICSKLTEAMTVSFEDNRFDELLEMCNAAAVGPGLGQTSYSLDILKKMIDKCRYPLVIDADGLNLLKDNLSLLKERKYKTILTPHPGEMARISGMSIDYINNNRLDAAKYFAHEYGVVLLLKGYNTIITDGNRLAVNTSGNSAMASGGMGDCLTGMIASFIAQGYDSFEAPCMAAFVHGLCGDRLAENMYCVSASDILSEIPFAINDI